MNNFFSCILDFFNITITDNGIQQRSVELPENNPHSTLDTAAKICQRLIANGFVTQIQRRFPELTQEQLSMLLLKWNAGVFLPAKKSVFITTGIEYTESMSDTKAIAVADYCKTLVENAVAEEFSSIT